MTRNVLLMILAATAAGCDAAKASSYDSSDPIQCTTILGATSGTLRKGPLAGDLNARILFIVRSNGGPEWLRRASPGSAQHAARWKGQRISSTAL